MHRNWKNIGYYEIKPNNQPLRILLLCSAAKAPALLIEQIVSEDVFHSNC